MRYGVVKKYCERCGADITGLDEKYCATCVTIVSRNKSIRRKNNKERKRRKNKAKRESKRR